MQWIKKKKRANDFSAKRLLCVCVTQPGKKPPLAKVNECPARFRGATTEKKKTGSKSNRCHLVDGSQFSSVERSSLSLVVVKLNNPFGLIQPSPQTHYLPERKTTLQSCNQPTCRKIPDDLGILERTDIIPKGVGGTHGHFLSLQPFPHFSRTPNDKKIPRAPTEQIKVTGSYEMRKMSAKGERQVVRLQPEVPPRKGGICKRIAFSSSNRLVPSSQSPFFVFLSMAWFT
ncbi:hypothetical protein CEXT_495491 [Caerostris extrusa]|uniref:Uncharacterized protein n=1 Tax=Caerostris extrusa TaxID=172846 RepID=A0AAV4PZM2_CAEEX|nr:hypothetical protein CEXT_495491 [Caerostris extrusa]